MEKALGRGDPIAVMFLDLDRFKSVNDSLGHSVGDALLCAVTERLQRVVALSDTVARLGGDEFAIVQRHARPAGASELAGKIIAELAEPFEVQGHQLIVGTSIGIAMAPADGNEPDQLLRNADMALYRAKSDGRGTYHFFQPEMDAQMQDRRKLELDLRKALQGDEFELNYQPLIDLARDEVCGFEALLRWKHPERGLVSPDEFIPVAEEIGLIVPLGDWVLKQACRDAASWPVKTAIAVNLSPVQFRNPMLALSIVSALGQSGLAAARLELEITESVLLQADRNVLDALHQFRDLGVRICMDDFGTGYSSLSYLRSFPFDKIKIDRSFIRELGKDNDCMAIIRAVMRLVSSLGMITTAEGVETEEQLEILRAEGCMQVQGFLFSKAVPPLKFRCYCSVCSHRLGPPSRFTAPDQAPRGAALRRLQGCSITSATYISVHRKLLSGNIGRGRADWPLEGALMALRDVTLDDKYDLGQRHAFVTGFQALVRLCLMQKELDRRNGLTTAGYVTGSRGSPLGNLDSQFLRAKRFLDISDIRFQGGINEDLAATAVWGSQQAALRGEGKYDGVFAMWYGKGPGV